jgi:hypothetical protein
MPPRIARLAGLGAIGASAGLLALLALLVFGTRPTEYSGMDGTTRWMTWIAVAGVILALVAVHVMLGRRLLNVARELRERA